jgi:hypothetical protein
MRIISGMNLRCLHSQQKRSRVSLYSNAKFLFTETLRWLGPLYGKVLTTGTEEYFMLFLHLLRWRDVKN